MAKPSAKSTRKKIGSSPCKICLNKLLTGKKTLKNLQFSMCLLELGYKYNITNSSEPLVQALVPDLPGFPGQN